MKKSLILLAFVLSTAFSSFGDYKTDMITMGILTDFTARVALADQILVYTNTPAVLIRKANALASLGRIDESIQAVSSLPYQRAWRLYKYGRKHEAQTVAKAGLVNFPDESLHNRLTLLYYATQQDDGGTRNQMVLDFFNSGNFDSAGIKGNYSRRLKEIWRRYDRSAATVEEYRGLCENALKNIELTKTGWTPNTSPDQQTEPFLSFVRGELEKLPSGDLFE